MCAKIAVVYNKPEISRYSTMGEETAVLGVLESVEAVGKALIELKHDLVLLPISPPHIQPKLQFFPALLCRHSQIYPHLGLST